MGFLVDKTALIVDAEPILAMEISLGLQELGCANVIVSKTPGRADAMLTDVARVDIALLEIAVRGESSLPLAQRLLREGATVVLTSALSDRTTRMQTAHLPVLLKPFTFSEVVDILSENVTLAV
jgi:DNA-binding response OmpR family regulator